MCSFLFSSLSDRPTHLHEREGDGKGNILLGWPKGREAALKYETSLAIDERTRISKNCSLQDGQFEQGFATSVTYSFRVYIPLRSFVQSVTCAYYNVFRDLQSVFKYSFATAGVTLCPHKVFIGSVHTFYSSLLLYKYKSC